MGLGGALVGLILYAAVGILLHVEIGFVSLAVGFIVGKAMMRGSGNIGGRRYQWTAVLLTYAAVSLSAVPIAISQYNSVDHKPLPPIKRKAEPQASAPAAAEQAPAQPGSTDAAAPQAVEAPEAATAGDTPARPQGKPRMSFGRAMVALLMLGLASPLLEFAGNPVSALIGIVILFVGIRIAWRITAGARLPTVAGPY
jgi:hypothetical protein